MDANLHHTPKPLECETDVNGPVKVLVRGGVLLQEPEIVPVNVYNSASGTKPPADPFRRSL